MVLFFLPEVAEARRMQPQSKRLPIVAVQSLPKSTETDVDLNNL